MNDTTPQSQAAPTIGQEPTQSPSPQPPKDTPPQKVHRGTNAGRILFGFTLVVLGLLYLAETTGWIDITFSLWQLWPLAIVFLGISLMTKSSWGIWVMVVLVLLVAAGISTSSLWIDEREVQMSDISIDVSENATAGKLNIDMGAGSLEIDSSSEMFAEGSFQSDFSTLTRAQEVGEDGVQSLSLTTEGKWSGFGTRVNELDLRLTDSLPLDLFIESGAMSMDLDFTEVMLHALDIDTGASSLNLTLGDLVDEAQVNIDAGASSVNIILPRSLGVQLEVDSGLSSKTLNEFVETGEDMYRSENYDEAEIHMTIVLDLGVSSLNIDWQD